MIFFIYIDIVCLSLNNLSLILYFYYLYIYSKFNKIIFLLKILLHDKNLRKHEILCLGQPYYENYFF